MTRRLLKISGAVVLVLLALPVLAAGTVLIAANVDPGRRLIESEIASLSGGTVRLDGLSGRFPDALRVGQIQVSDAKGLYLTISGLILDWSPLQLIHRDARIDKLQADRLDFSRLPEAEGKASSSNGSFNLPIRIDLRQLHVSQAIIGAPVAGIAATLALDGSADIPSLQRGFVQLDAQRLDNPGHYAVSGRLTPAALEATLTVNEPAHGLIANIAHLPDLGAITMQASANGPIDNLATQVGITAGALTASASGTVDWDHQAADLAVNAQAPAMAPAPGVSWRSVLLDAKLHGPFTKPDAVGTVKINSLQAGDAIIGALAAEITGNAGQVQLAATVADLHIPGPKPDIFAGEPVTLSGTARLDASDRPVTFALHHPLLALQGTARTAAPQQAQARLTLPDLAPLAAAGGVALSGHTELDLTAATQDATTTATVKGNIAITGGIAPVPALIGPDGRIDVAVSLHGQDVTLARLTLGGKALDVSADGGLSGRTINLDWTVAATDLAAIEASLSGKLDAKGHAGGKLDDMTVQAAISTDLAAQGFSSGHITASVDAAGLPATPHATVNANGTLLDAPLSLALTAAKTNSAVSVTIGQASWKSLRASGTANLTPPAVIPTGNLRLEFARLADLQPLLGRAIAGQAEATLNADDKAATLALTVRDATLPGTAAITKALLNATISDPTGRPTIDATLTADGVSTSAAKSMAARVSAKGPPEALQVNVAAHAPDVGGGPAALSTTGTLNAQDRTLVLARMEASWKQQVLKLLAPAEVGFAEGVAVKRLRLGFRQAELTVSGKAGTALDLTASLRNLPVDIAAVVNPAFAANGVIAADARLTGTGARPQGTVKLTATGVQQRQGPGQALPPANLVSNITLQGASARVDANLTAGPSHLAVTGSAPVSETGHLDLHTNGHVDLAMLDPLLSSQGRRARGDISLDAAVTGTTAAPQVRGTAALRNGDVTDFALGAHVSDLKAVMEASGDTIRLSSFAGKAGPGSVGGSGTMSLAGTMPIDLRFTADNARPLSSDLLTALIDANLTVQGEVKGNLQAGGTLHVRRADIRVPDKLPPGIAVLPVRDAGATPPPPPQDSAAPSTIALNLTLSAPQQVFIRGRGLDAEVGGTIHIQGSASNPVPNGGLELRRGTFSLVGSTLKFTEGRIDFSGAGLADPSIRFVATSSTSTMLATLTISGSAKDPKITLSSVPDMPQDEILAQLLFNTSTSKLSAFQIAEIAAALASLSGATSGFDPLERLRGTLGLDRLSIGNDAAGNPSLQAGRYVARGVYVGASQSATGGGTQATVQVDIAKGLKFQTTAGSGSTVATGGTSSSDAASVGLTYQFQY